MTDGPRASPLGDHITSKDDKGDQPSGGEATWTNTGATRYGREQHRTGSFGDDMLRPSPNHGTQRLPNEMMIMMMKWKLSIFLRRYRYSLYSAFLASHARYGYVDARKVEKAARRKRKNES